MSHVSFRSDTPVPSVTQRRGTTFLSTLLLSVLLSIATGERPVKAQVEFVVSGRLDVAPSIQLNGGQQPLRQGQSVRNLKDGLAATDWNHARRGPLIALDAESVRPWMPERDPGDWYTPRPGPQPLVPPTTGRGLSIETVAPYFGRKVIRTGSVSVLAPTEMFLINTRLPKPDPLNGLRRNEKMTLFQALLDEGQWKKLCSEQGLGLGDLQGEQRDLFLALLPNPVSVVQYKPYPGGGITMVYPGTPDGQSPKGPVDPRTTLTEAQRQGVRLRINRVTSMNIPMANAPQGAYYGGGAYVDNQSAGDKPWYSLASGEEYGRADSYGVRIRDKVPSRLKQGHLDFDSPSLNPAVSLTEVKTVEDLMKRIREATRLEIYADMRVGRLLVTGVGLEGEVRTGDVLKALAWAITGAYRKVGPVFILTDDVQGIGSRRAYINAWETLGQVSKQKMLEKARRQIQEKAPMQHTRFAPDDPMALNDDMMKRIESKWNTNIGRYQGEQLRLLDLPPVMQEKARNAINNHQSNDPNGRSPILTDRVQVNVQVNVSLIIPGMGTVRADNFGWYDGIQSLMPPPTEPDFGPGRTPPSTDPASIPARMAAGGVLYVAPKTAEETVVAAEVAKLRGMKQLWVLLPVDLTEGKAILTAAIKAGKAQGIPVYAVLRLMVAPPVQPLPKDPTVTTGSSDNPVNLNITSAPEDRDRNILGETASMALVRQMSMPERWPGYLSNTMIPGDWLRPDAPLTTPTLKQRVIGIANTPGLSGIVLRDLVPNGYETKSGNEGYYYGSGGDYGYSESNRVALIRKASIDPIDITGQNYTEANIDLPFFRDQYRNYIRLSDGSVKMDTSSVNPADVWAQLRFDIGMQVLADVYRSIRKETPANIPILASEIGMNFGGRWYGTWEAGDKVPVRQNPRMVYYEGGPPPTTPKRPIDMAREVSKTVYTSVMPYRNLRFSPEMDRQKIKYGTPEFVAMTINSILEMEAKQKDTWDGLVLDLTDYPMSEVKDLVLGAIAPPKKSVGSLE